MATTAFTEQLRFITTTVIGWMDVITRPQHKHIAVDTTISNDNMNSYYRIANADTRCGRIANPTKRKPQTILGTVGNPLFLIFILCIIIIVSCGRQEKGTTNVSVTEEMKKDTIYSTEGVLIIDIPHSAFVQRDSYEEGFFVSYFFPEDSVILTVHWGTMIQSPMISFSDKELIKFEENEKRSSFQVVKVYRDDDRLRGIEKYSREDDYICTYYHVSYENATKNSKYIYDNILDNIIVEKK